MKRAPFALAVLALVTAAGCASTDAPAAEPATPTSAAAPRTTTTAPTAAPGRIPGQAIQKSLYIQGMSEVYADNGMTIPDTTTPYAEFADSICNYLDGGASTVDANEVMTESGFSVAEANRLVPLAIGGYCTEHFPS